jgi:diguanylate cyclase (GGDEF)-like protein/PAS domain S-box-containing protein
VAQPEFATRPENTYLRDAGAVPVVVVSPRQDDAEAVNQALRNAGAAAHCAWVAEARRLAAATATEHPSLIFVVADKSMEGVVRAVHYRNKHATTLPVIVVATEVDERAMAEAMQAGAQDVVSFDQIERFQAVALRELASSRRARALEQAEREKEEYRLRMERIIAGTARAILQVQQGIVASANPACLELLGYAEPIDLAGTPVMDLFDPDSQATLKGALVACEKGKWTGPGLRVRALCSDGSSLPVEAVLELDHIDGEACVRIDISSIREATDNTEVRVAIDSDPLAGLAQRRRFLALLEEKLREELKGGMRALYQIRLDGLTGLAERMGPVICDELMIGAGRVVSELLKPGDMFGQLPGGHLGVLVERGNERDVIAWAEHARTKIAENRVEAGERVMQCTCSIGVAIFEEKTDALGSLAARAAKACRLAREAGGNRVQLDEKRTHTSDDARAVVNIRNALMKNGFKLIFQPIAHLHEQANRMFDVLVRMVDSSNREILPNQFLPAAERNGLMKSIDRWVLGNAVQACREQATDVRLFVRLSSDSIPDLKLVDWLRQQLQRAEVDPQKIVVQVTEESAEAMLYDTVALVGALRALGCGFAIEHFGVGKASHALFEQLPMNYLKIDGSLMQGLHGNAEIQQRVSDYIKAAEAKSITTIAERVEDANTMAVLWRLGVEFVQGYYVQGPEQVVLEST